MKKERAHRLRRADLFIKECLHRFENPSSRGRKPTPQGTYDRIQDFLWDHNLLSFYEVELRNDEVIIAADKKTRVWEDKIDGMLLLETTDLKSKPEDVVRRYKELAKIERGWRALKSSLMLRPVYHWTEDRIKAGEMQVNGVKTRTLTRTTEEQKNLFKFLEVPTPRMARVGIL